MPGQSAYPNAMHSLNDAITAALSHHANEIQQFIDIEKILLCLRSKGIVQNSEYLENVKKNKKEQALFLQEKISTGGDDAFPALLECLKMNNHKSLVENILKFLEKQAESLEKETEGLLRNEDLAKELRSYVQSLWKSECSVLVRIFRLLRVVRNAIRFLIIADLYVNILSIIPMYLRHLCMEFQILT